MNTKLLVRDYFRLLFAILFCFSLSSNLRGYDLSSLTLYSAGINVSWIPVHTKDPSELRGLGGAQAIIPGETITWTYAFPWQAIAVDGRRIPIRKDLSFTFVENLGNGWKLEKNGQIYTVAKPPNNAEWWTPFELTEISLEGATKEIVFNRIGKPTRTLKTEEGVVFHYHKEITHQKLVYDTVTSSTTGNFAGNGFNATTTTTAPRVETTKTCPYSFLVFFNADGKVDRIEDAWGDVKESK